MRYRSDINFDSNVDGSDVAQVLNDRGNVPATTSHHPPAR